MVNLLNINKVIVENRLIDKAEHPSINSAYDVLVRKQSDCNARSQTTIAFFDRMGYATIIEEYPNHAEAYMKIDGKWYLPGGMGFYETTITDAYLKKPKYGPLEETTY